VQVAKVASVAWPLSWAASLAAAQASAGPVESTFPFDHFVPAKAGAAPSSMTTPKDKETKHFKDIRTSAKFPVLSPRITTGIHGHK
jgi:hypothetical protein